MSGATKEYTITLAILLALALLGAPIVVQMLPDRPTAGEIARCIFAVSSMFVLTIILLLRTAAIVRVWWFLRHPRLSDEAFMALLLGPSRIDLASVQQARALAVKYLDGARYYPTDRLDKDLNLFRRPPDGFPGLVRDLAKRLEIDEDDMRRDFRTRGLATFGDLIQTVAEYERLAKLDSTKAHANPRPLWDRDPEL
jgi:hypothetical protein